jgi:hypothetical protein
MMTIDIVKASDELRYLVAGKTSVQIVALTVCIVVNLSSSSWYVVLYSTFCSLKNIGTGEYSINAAHHAPMHKSAAVR